MCRFLLVCSKIKQSLWNLAIFSHVPQVIPHDINEVNFYLVCVLFEHFPVSTVGASVPTTPTIHSPVSNRSFDSEAPSPRPYYMLEIMSSPGPLFESSDEATMDHTYALKINECDTALPDVTPNSPSLKQDLPVSSEPIVVSTNVKLLPDKTTDKLPDKMDSQQASKGSLLDTMANLLPDATTTTISELPDETNSLEPMSNLLPDVTVKVVQDTTDTTDSMVLDATIEYPLSMNDTTETAEGNNTVNMTNVESKEVNNKAPIVDTDTNTNLMENNISHETRDEKSDASWLKDCIIKLTDLSAEERNKWLGFI